MFAYLDHAATTPLRPEALAAMLPVLSEGYGNPSGSHRVARMAKERIEDSRDRIAAVLGCNPSEVVFTSGGTEADNLAIRGVDGRPVCSAVEHHAVLHPVQAAGGGVVAVGHDGLVDLDRLAGALDDTVGVVSVMLVNNEVGVIQPVADVVRVVRDQAPGALVHTDAVQAVSWIDVSSVARDVDLLSIAGHKLGGPQGAGALVVRSGARLRPLLLGGGQEQERRSGTHNVAGIVGMAAALDAAATTRDEMVERVSLLRERLVREILTGVADAVETAGASPRVPGIVHLCFPGVESEELLFVLDEGGVQAAAGSACASGALEPSHVLTAMGVPAATAAGALRLSMGWTTTEADVELAAAAVVAAVRRLRGA